MNEFKCPNCGGSTFKMIKDEENSKFYGYDVFKVKCINCGNEFGNDKYIYLLNTFSKTQKEIDNIISGFNTDADLLKNNISKLIGIKNNTGDLENILRKLNFIYFEENTEIPNSLNTIATLINCNLPNGIHGEFQNIKNQEKNNEDSKGLKLLDENGNNVGSIKISHGLNNIMEVLIKTGKKKYEPLTIDVPLRIIKVLLRINEIFNYTV